MQAAWRPAYANERYVGAQGGDPNDHGVLLSAVGRSFQPQWVWEVPLSPSPSPPLCVRGGRHAGDVLISSLPERRVVRMGYCADAVLDPKFNIWCAGGHAATVPPPEPPGRLNVTVFPQNAIMATMFAHHMLDAVALLGLAAPLVRAGYRITWVHSGLLDEAEAHILLRPPSWFSLRDQLPVFGVSRLRNLVVPLALPPSPRGDLPGTRLAGFLAPPNTRQPEAQREWYERQWP